MRTPETANVSASPMQRRVAPQGGGHDPAERSADREHGSPCRSHQHVGSGQVLGIDDVRDGSVGGGLEHRGEDSDRGCEDVRHPHFARLVHQEEAERQDHTHHVGEHHEAPPVEAVGKLAAERREDRDREHVSDQHERHGRGRLARQVVHPSGDRDHREPVAHERDERGRVEAGEGRVAREERERCPDTRAGRGWVRSVLHRPEASRHAGEALRR